MPIRIFYAWQSDRPSRTHKEFIRDVLDKAVEQLREGSEVQEAERPEVEVDQDTQGEVGLVNVFASIQKKIISSDIFVCDLTHVCEYTHPSGKKKRAQNGNVLIELGFAMRNIDHRRIICVMNTKHGSGEGLPFDLNLYRHPVGYELGLNATDDDILIAQANFTATMKTAVETSLSALAADRAMEVQALAVDEVEEGRLRAAEVRQKLKADIEANRLSRFTAGDQMISMTCVPLIAGQTLPLTRLQDRSMYLRPLSQDVGAIFNDVDSVGTSVVEDNRRKAVTRVFEDATAIGAAWIETADHRGRKLLRYYWAESRLIECVGGIIAMSKANGIRGPWEVSAALWNVSGETFTTDTDYFNWDVEGRFHDGFIQPKPATIGDEIEPGDIQKIATALKPILDGFWRAAGFARCMRFDREGHFEIT